MGDMSRGFGNVQHRYGQHLLQRILAVLTEHAGNSDFVYRHTWRQGDVLFWDNGCTLHRRDPIAADHARFMKRMTIYLRGERHCLPH